MQPQSNPSILRRCAVEDCTLPFYGRGWCKRHYHLWWRNGTPYPKPATLSLTHGHAVGKEMSPTYISWCAMKARCTNSHLPHYKNYGGRGITVCERWLTFENFLADMGERPAGRTLDRRDNDGNYEPNNCRWATWVEQRANRRDTQIERVE